MFDFRVIESPDTNPPTDWVEALGLQDAEPVTLEGVYLSVSDPYCEFLTDINPPN